MFVPCDSQVPRCWAEIDSQALSANIQALPVPRSSIMAIVKANAYGHGIDLVAPILAQAKVVHWGLATVAEGIQVREILDKLKVDGHIYIMPAVLAIEAPALVAARLTPYCSDIELARALSTYASLAKTTAEIHIEVDTGIGRAGVSPADLSAFAASVERLPNLKVTGICTHFTAADSLSGPQDAIHQHAVFERALDQLSPGYLRGLIVHAANSPATLRIPEAHRHLIRPGLLLYGIAPSTQFTGTADIAFPYKPVLSLRARALLVRRLPAGSDISYSRTHRLEHDATIATIGIGYGDGFPRRLSNTGCALLPDGNRAAIRGRVCMDQVCIELPESSSLKPGDPVTLIGCSGRDRITALEIADTIGATPHEVTTCLMPRVPRLLV